MSKKIEAITKEVGKIFHGVILFISALGFIVYMVVVFLTYVLNQRTTQDLKERMTGRELFNLGLPFAAAGAYAIVALLLHVFPPEKQRDSIKFKAFGMEFTGPAGPITLWVVCFLSIIVAIKALS
jgi:uncharacterized membrane protein YsdA (DUF1294 family)